jgi:hypothetical protein
MLSSFTRQIKNFFKKHFYYLKVWNKFSPSVQIQQRQLFHYYQDGAKSGKRVQLKDTGFSVFSQYEEDGILLFIFACIGVSNKTFVEIGSNDGVNSNCANLAINFGWHGLFIDGDETAIKRGKHFYSKYPDPWSYPPQFICAKVTRENINDLIQNAGFKGEIDLLSIDIDGNDYWIWDALEIIAPRVVIIETHVEFGYNNVVVPYDPAYSFPGKHPVYHGASPVAMSKLANRKGYRLVGANNYGHNNIFVKNGFGDDLIPEVTVESILQHPSAKESFKLFDAIKEWKYVEGK